MIQKAFLLSCFLFIFLSNHLWAQSIREDYERAVDAYNNGKYDEAIDNYQKILKDSPKFVPAYVGTGLALKGKGADLEEVLYYYKTAVNIEPDNTQALEQLGRLYYTMNRFDLAEEVFLKVLKVNPSLKEVKLALAWVYLLGKNKPQSAIKYFKAAIAVEPTANAYFGLGMAYFANNNRMEALDVITHLKSIHEDDLASQLEQAVRENQQVYTSPSPAQSKSITSRPPISNQPSNSSQKSPASSGEPVAAGKIKLRGKLADLN